MAVFADVNDAVEAGLAASEALAPIEVEGYRPRLRTGVHVGRPRRLGGDYLGVDVNIAARVVDAAGAGEVIASDTAFASLDHERFQVGRDKRLKATGAPRELRVARVQRAR
jgi:class 3 adenylate cyclase